MKQLCWYHRLVVRQPLPATGEREPGLKWQLQLVFCYRIFVVFWRATLPQWAQRRLGEFLDVQGPQGWGGHPTTHMSISLTSQCKWLHCQISETNHGILMGNEFHSRAGVTNWRGLQEGTGPPLLRMQISSDNLNILLHLGIFPRTQEVGVDP